MMPLSWKSGLARWLAYACIARGDPWGLRQGLKQKSLCTCCWKWTHPVNRQSLLSLVPLVYDWRMVTWLHAPRIEIQCSRACTLLKYHQRFFLPTLLGRGFCGFWTAISDEIWKLQLLSVHIRCKVLLRARRKYSGRLYLEISGWKDVGQMMQLPRAINEKKAPIQSMVRKI